MKNRLEHRIQSKKYKFFIVCVLLSVFCVLSFGIAFASEGTGPPASWQDWLWRIVNFAILVFILVKFGGKPLKEFLRKRTELIEKTLREAEEAKELAKKALEEVQSRLQGADREVGDILDTAKRAGEKEKEVLIAQGKTLQNKVFEQTKANIAYELQKAKEEIRAEAAAMAIELAEKNIKEKLGKKEHEKLIEESIKKLEARN